MYKELKRVKKLIRVGCCIVLQWRTCVYKLIIKWIIEFERSKARELNHIFTTFKEKLVIIRHLRSCKVNLRKIYHILIRKILNTKNTFERSSRKTQQYSRHFESSQNWLNMNNNVLTIIGYWKNSRNHTSIENNPPEGTNLISLDVKKS